MIKFTRKENQHKSDTGIKFSISDDQSLMEVSLKDGTTFCIGESGTVFNSKMHENSKRPVRVVEIIYEEL